LYYERIHLGYTKTLKLNIPKVLEFSGRCSFYSTVLLNFSALLYRKGGSQMPTYTPSYPTPQHEIAAQKTVEFFSRQPGVEAVLLTCSIARGKASPDSCLDIAVLVRPDPQRELRGILERAWEAHQPAEPAFEALRQVGRFSFVDLDFDDGCFNPGWHGWTSGPDGFELEIGNLLAYAVPLWEGGTYYRELCQQWLPYYSDELCHQRLDMVVGYCLNNLRHIPLYVERGLYFQSFNRLYHAFGEFLQALFISRKVYPIAYDKWVKEEVAEILGLPELYDQLPHLFEIQKFESRELTEKAQQLESLLDTNVRQLWYHGSPLQFDTLRAGSTITHQRSLARVFSHKPTLVSMDGEPDALVLQHNGTLPGFLYIVENVHAEDVYPHPRTSMPSGFEWLTRRDLRLRLLGPVTIDPHEVIK
jgi:hypothetical protein